MPGRKYGKKPMKKKSKPKMPMGKKGKKKLY